MDNLAEKGFGHVVRKAPHVFFVIDTESLATNYTQLGLTYDEVSKALSKPSQLPPKFEYLTGNHLILI